MSFCPSTVICIQMKGFLFLLLIGPTYSVESFKDICSDDEFACEDGSRCILGTYFCDGKEDCRDGSDEIARDSNIPGIVCRQTLYICKLPFGQIVKRRIFCKKRPDCSNNEFACEDGSACLPRPWFCSGIITCRDGSDEIAGSSRLPGKVCYQNSRKCKLPISQLHKERDFCKTGEKCGQALNVGISQLYRTVDGIDARDDAWPWQVLIKQNSQTSTQSLMDWRVIGGGSILDQNWILTAAHVVNQCNTKGLILFVGVTERSHDKIRSSVEAYSIRNCTAHRRFNQRPGHYDIALIEVGNKLDKNLQPIEGGAYGLTFNKHIRPVCLPCTDYFVKTGSSSYSAKGMKKCLDQVRSLLSKNPTAVVTGFGHTARRSPNDEALTNITMKAPKKLQQAEVRIASRDTCRRGMRRIRSDYRYNNCRFHRSMICTVPPSNTSLAAACHGDSGGPLVMRDKKGTGESRWIQVGIVSFGYGCGQRYPGYYTNVGRFIRWICRKAEQLC